MRYMRQLGIILAITFAGELLKAAIPLPIPASIYGLILMLVALSTKVIKLSSVHDVGKFLIEIMPLMFIPAGVGLLESWGQLYQVLAPVVIITAITTVLVMVVTGKATQFVIRLGGKRQNERDDH